MKNKTTPVLLFILFISLALLYFSKEFYDDFLVAKANYYFKKNNITEAQKFFEKAFELGIDDTDNRETYVNLIINSPLTTEAQERLVKFLNNNKKEDSASLKAEYFLYDIKREIHRKYPDNYIANAVYNQKIVRWGKLPITYAFINPENAPEYFIKEIEDAFTEWEKATEHKIFFEEDTKNPNIIIKFEENTSTTEENLNYVMASTKIKINSKFLENMNIIFYTKTPYGDYYTNKQVFNTALHEIAHALGFMGHSNNDENILYIKENSYSVKNNIRNRLTEADINTIKLLYEIKPHITNGYQIKSKYIPSLALGEKEEVSSEKYKEAKFYVANAPDMSSGYISLAEVLINEKNYPKAIKTLEKALQLANTKELQEIIYYNLAVTYFHIDHLELSRDYLQKSIEISDTDQKHYLLGEIYVREGKKQDAIKEYKHLINKNPKNIEYTIALTNIYVLEHNYVQARKVLKNYYKKNPKDKNNPRFSPYGILTLGL